MSKLSIIFIEKKALKAAAMLCHVPEDKRRRISVKNKLKPNPTNCGGNDESWEEQTF